ncbi:HDIG domain-containing metalloprotein [Anaerosporobacter faecicola]|uniref:HDIG domain-containing metalloprotein n=1 Tax=Anaerosporobacter faecicola TaxID=2718714 RepID=UPI00143A28C4|nr:HDIG domain-containing metalloprotein [Anaerosporobacter faecicola]
MLQEEAQELFDEIMSHLLQDECPSEYMNTLLQEERFQTYPFVMLYELKGTKQSPIHHPEGDAWNHTMLVIDEAAQIKKKSRNDAVFMWAALLHDIGKPSTTRIRKGKITSYDHDKVGESLARELLEYSISRERVEHADLSKEQFIENVSSLVRYHMHVLYIGKNLPFSDRPGLMQRTDIREVALIGYADRMGRTCADRYQIRKDIEHFYHICKREKKKIQEKGPKNKSVVNTTE